MKKLILFVLLFVFCFSFLGIQSAKADDRIPLVQIALLLDTSNSMDGLISQAKSQLWKFVNELADASHNGREPMLYVALYEYGNDSLSAREGYIRQISGFTYDLDKISEELFALDTNGGTEYCGQVIDKSTKTLDWSKYKDDLKIVFIAGNEEFTQGNVKYKDACGLAKSKNIVVNTVFCGPFKRGVDTMWKDGAVITGGEYMNIDQDRKAIHIVAPQDKEIEKLGLALNKTYIPYGSLGSAGFARQAEQEVNAKAAAPGSYLQRSVAKSSKYYRADSWDLVDAVKEKKIDLGKIKINELPKNMQKMTVAERKTYVATETKKRADIQNKIKNLNAVRKTYVAKKMKELSSKGQDTLDNAMIKAVRKQASTKGFKLK